MSNVAPTEVSPQQLARIAELGPLYAQSANASANWVDRLDSAEYENALRSIALYPDETLSLYVHIPFCPGRCLYCACNTTVTHDTAWIDRYLDAIDQEMALAAEQLRGDHDVLQLHLAGGTPNYLNDSQLTRLTEIIERRFRIIPDTDLSIECDPRRTSAGQLDLLHALGYRRITFGVQDLDPQVQRAIGRLQSIDLIRDVYAMARETGFDAIAFDLIYGLPEQTEASFQATLDAIVDLAPDRIACFGYARTTAQGTHQFAIDAHRLPSATERQALFHRAVSTLTTAGYAWIGLDVFALDTDELAIAQEEGRLRRNCIGYTSIETDHTLGFGSGAIGDVGEFCVQNEMDINTWIARVANGELPVAHGHRVNDRDRRRRDAIEHMICNLELPAEIAAGCLDDEYARLASYAADGLVQVEPDRLRITASGRYFLRTLCSEHGAYFEWDRSRWHFSRSL
ncbi:oxygen-independent coproporphyrinogen III oxidase [Lamprobacter modestohalophilus]|uniref:oxygen-independent coproporphyrinogen III oxidase n=1 Tax=Lamprobacter modestohalophilus TaxID=1064514 RepID=UPI002ADED9F9|nr:oxygen-independent coproporphyrinogen III oxidase [Lamprobacter modestohalophilus]MEA1049384.1 oxygen-independent coproporphyrinogen III oxidase [Lamprobacter modestohalophilus]